MVEANPLFDQVTQGLLSSASPRRDQIFMCHYVALWPKATKTSSEQTPGDRGTLLLWRAGKGATLEVQRSRPRGAPGPGNQHARRPLTAPATRRPVAPLTLASWPGPYVKNVPSHYSRTRRRPLAACNDSPTWAAT